MESYGTVHVCQVVNYFSSRVSFEDLCYQVFFGDWTTVVFHIYDTPALHKEKIEERMDYLKRNLSTNLSDRVHLVAPQKCDNSTLNMSSNDLILRKPKTLYYDTNSTYLLKVIGRDISN